MAFVRSVLSVAVVSVIAVAGVVSAPAVYAAPDDPVIFADPDLQACVNVQLGQGAGAVVTEAQMGSISSLYCASRSIGSVEGLQYATSLTNLILSGNQVVDVSPLAGLTSLGGLGLSGNQVVDVSPLAGLTSLSDLDLSGNQVVDVSPLAGLTSLSYLDLGGQVSVQPDAVVGVPVLNPVRGLDGVPVPVTDSALCGNAGCTEMVYPVVGTGVSADWSTSVSNGSVTTTFSGSLTRDVTAPVGPTPVRPALSGVPDAGVVGTPYEFAFTVGGVPAPTVAVSSGSLPDGLSMTAEGVVSGTPTQSGTFSVTVTATNVAGAVSVEVVFTVTEPPVPPVEPPVPPVEPPVPPVGDPGKDGVGLAATGGVSPFAGVLGAVVAGVLGVLLVARSRILGTLVKSSRSTR